MRGGVLRMGGIMLAAAAVAGCSIEVNDDGYGPYVRYEPDAFNYTMRRITIEQPAVDRAESGVAMEQILDTFRKAGCEVISAERWRRLAERDGPDYRGMRVVASCPKGATVL